MRLALILFVLTTAATPVCAAETPDFAREVLPVLRGACFDCHGPQKQKGGLRLDSPTNLKKGGDSGDAVVPGKPGNSELLRRVTLPKGDPEIMPARGEPLTKSQVEILRRWIAAGAKWPDDVSATHWAYVKPVRPKLPNVENAAWIRNPIDAFVLARLEREGLKPSPEAPKAVLLRRVYLDLIGLPPTPAEVDAFLNDTAPDAYEKVVDRLLESPQYGVKWARPWLDAARYADSHGFQRDDFRDLWPYRDWVVNALNADMPFDRFTIEQLAGDLLPKPTEAQLIATGFNRTSPTNVEAGTEPEETRVNQVLDRVNTVGMVWLGTTLECCQCHDHKYDPFTSRDYYRLFAFFNNTELEANRANPKVPGSIKFLGPEMKLKSVEGESGKPATTQVMRELPQPRKTHMLIRGDYHNAGEPVQPGTPAILPPLDAGKTRLTRLDLAKWLVSVDNPLTPRVTVNRLWAEIFGQGLVRTPEDFGIKGEPPTHPGLLDWLAVELANPGRQSGGAEAEHPGIGVPGSPWSQKHLLRLIVTSATYRQSSRVKPELLARDDRNLLLARGPRFRLDAEGIRDNALSIAGLLSEEQGGPPIKPYQPAGIWVKVGGQRYEYVVSPGERKYRRGLYVIWKRGAPYPSFMAFDANNRMACRVKRPRSNTPLQALTLLNDPVYVEAAAAFANRVITEKPEAGTEERIEHAFRLAVARSPRPEEIRILRALFEAERESLARDPAAVKKLIASLNVLRTDPWAGWFFAAEKFQLPAGTTPAEFAAWYAVCTALLNLDETITKG